MSMQGVSVQRVISGCDFLVSWQKRKMLSLVDSSPVEEEDGVSPAVERWNELERGRSMVDGVLRSLFGGRGLDDLDPLEEREVDHIIREWFTRKETP